jgi:3'-5' exonuclease
VARTPSAEYLILDIETIPDVERWQRPEPMPEGQAPPPETAPPPARPPRADRDGFPPAWAHRIVVIGCMWLDHHYRLKRLGVIGDPSGGTGTPDQRERHLLEDFSRFVGKARPVLVTYNGRSFDLPVIALRSLCHAVPLGWYYRERGVRYRFSEEGHLDLCDWLADHGATRAGKLDSVARLIGLPGKVGIDGSQVDGLYQDGRLDLIQKYCLADVAQTAFLFLRFRLLQGQLSTEAYRDRTGLLIDALAADGRVGEVLEGLDREHLLGPTPPTTLPA